MQGNSTGKIKIYCNFSDLLHINTNEINLYEHLNTTIQLCISTIKNEHQNMHFIYRYTHSVSVFAFTWENNITFRLFT